MVQNLYLISYSVQLSIDRIHMINKPQRTHLNITTKRILIKISLIYPTFILFVICYHYSLKYDPTAFTISGQSCRVYDHAHLWYYTIWPYINLLCRLIPCLIIVLCASYVCSNRCHQNYYHIQYLRPSIHRQQQTLSVVLVILSIYTFIAVIPLQYYNCLILK